MESLKGPPILLLITGSMRSGTSSLAGALSHLGWHVPEPVVPAEPRNPKGHFEPHWVVRFHKRHLAQARVRPSDSSPEARERVAAAVADGAAANELADWLADQPQLRLVVKDPHAHWFLDTWKEVADRTGHHLRLLTALRHPAEVVGSKERVWGHRRDDATRLAKETANVAGWLNVTLNTEAAGRSHPRAFIRYVDLVSDWRSALKQVSDQLGLELLLPPAETLHVVDEFLDTGLRGSRLTFDDITIPERLRDLASTSWVAMETLIDLPNDAQTKTRIDRVRVDYDRLYAESRAIVLDDRHYAARTASQAKAAKLRPRIQRLRQAVEVRDRRIADLTLHAAGPRPHALLRAARETRRLMSRVRR